MNKKTICLILLIGIAAVITAQENWLYLLQNKNKVLAFDRNEKITGFSYQSQLDEVKIILPTPGGASVYLVSKSGDRLEVFDAKNGQYQTGFSGDWQNITTLQFSPKGERLFVYDSGSRQLFIYEHRRLTLTPMQKLGLPKLTANIVFNSRGSRYYSAIGESVIIGDGYSGKIIKQIKTGTSLELLALSGNDRYIWAQGSEGLVQIDERRRKLLLSDKKNGGPGILAVSTTAKAGAAVSEGGIQLFDSYSGKQTGWIPQGGSLQQIFLDEQEKLWVVGSEALTWYQNAESSSEKREWLFTDLEGIAAIGSIKSGQEFACF